MSHCSERGKICHLRAGFIGDLCGPRLSFLFTLPKLRLILLLYKTNSKTLCKEIKRDYFNGSEISSLRKLWSALYCYAFVDQVIFLTIMIFFDFPIPC